MPPFEDIPRGTKTAVAYNADGTRKQTQSDEVLNLIEARADATRLFHLTGDSSRMKELGLIPEDSEIVPEPDDDV